MTSPVPSPSSTTTAPPGATRALILATVGFALNFWAWALLSPLGPIFVERGIAEGAALIVAIPVLVGSLGRIPIGALTDRFGGRIVFPITTLVTVIPVLFLGFIGQYNYVTLIVGGFFLGIAGTTFAIGVPYVNSWFPPAKRGLATGIYGAGMGGTAISAFTTVKLVNGVNNAAPFVITAIVLIAFAVIAWFTMPRSPWWQPQKKSIIASTGTVMKLPITWQACYLYGISFGGYVAFSVFLPTMLISWYALTPDDASLRMAGFVIVAVVMRPVGGALSDRIGEVATLLIGYGLVSAAAIVLAFQPALMPTGTIAFLAMAAGLGLGTGAVFALVGKHAEPDQVGAVTGFVGAAGGLGGFVPPLVMAAINGYTGSYSMGIVLLLIATLVAIALTLLVGRSARRPATT